MHVCVCVLYHGRPLREMIFKIITKQWERALYTKGGEQHSRWRKQHTQRPSHEKKAAVFVVLEDTWGWIAKSKVSKLGKTDCRTC